MFSPTYLHFLDRELGDSVDAVVPSNEVELALKSLVLGTSGGLYAGLSLVWEHPSVDGTVRWLLEWLLRGGILSLVSHHPRVDEFLASRRVLYRHDRLRYPAYFEDKEVTFRPTQPRPDGTTAALAGQLEELVGAPDGNLLPADARNPMERALSNRDGEAITFSYFGGYLTGVTEQTRGEVRRAISTLYSEHYRAFDAGELATGIRQLAYFDRLGNDFPCRDIPVLCHVLTQLGLGPHLVQPANQTAEMWEAVTGDDDFRQAVTGPVSQLILLASAAEQIGPPHVGDTARRRLCARLTAWIRSACETTGRPHTALDALREAASRAELAVASVLNSAPQLRELFSNERQGPTLLITATKVEDEQLLAVLRRRGHVALPMMAAELSYFDLGIFPIGRVFYVRCAAGGATRRGSQDVLSVAIPALAPARVIMVGIAFGVDPMNQPIGTVLVSDHVVNYDFVRHGTDADGKDQVLPRGTPGAADPSLVEAFRDQAVLHTTGTQTGLVLSGPELVDNRQHRDELVKRHPGAIGGEMEGYGVYVASLRRRTPWILVKAVCDWADGDKAADKHLRQRQASRSAAERLLSFLAR